MVFECVLRDSKGVWSGILTATLRKVSSATKVLVHGKDFVFQERDLEDFAAKVQQARCEWSRSAFYFDRLKHYETNATKTVQLLVEKAGEFCGEPGGAVTEARGRGE